MIRILSIFCVLLWSQVGAQISTDVLTTKAASVGMSAAELRRKAEAYGVSIPGESVDESNPTDVHTFNSHDDYVPENTADENEESDTEEESVLQDDMQSSKSIQPFGYDIFNLAKITFEPNPTVTVPDNYLVGPGDELIITVWGATQLHYQLTVQRNGSVLLPNVGLVSVNGKTLEDLRKVMLQRMSRYYSGLKYGKSGASSFLDVSVGQLKSIRIFVLGEVKKPGGYVLSSMATVFTGLYHAGGPTFKGSLREIEVKRNNEIISSIDMYDYLISGDNSNDIRLENGDIVFVKPMGKKITLDGEVFRPAQYELRPDETFKELLAFAGGYTYNADLDRLSIKRVIPFAEREHYNNDIVFIDFSASQSDAIAMTDGDEVKVFPVTGMYENFVAITGAVAKPGEFALTEGMTIRGLIEKAEGILGEAFLQKGEIVRTHPDLSREIISFNVTKVLEGNEYHDIMLMNLDALHIYSLNEFRDNGYVGINGAVRRPGTYTLIDSMTLIDVILKAGGFKDKASMTKAIEVYRLDDSEVYHFSKKYTIASVGGVVDIHTMKPFYLDKYDRIFIRENPAFVLQKTIAIRGEVTYPGVYPIESNTIRISDIILKAGGLKEDAFIDGFEFKRKEKIVFLDLHDILRKAKKVKKSKYDIFLRDGDELLITQNPHVVKVIGEVMAPALVLFQKGKSVKYYIEQAGGYTDASDKKRTQVKLANGKMWKKKCLIFHPPLTAGTIITVPKKVEKETRFWEYSRDIVAIISGLATTALVIQQIK